MERQVKGEVTLEFKDEWYTTEEEEFIANVDLVVRIASYFSSGCETVKASTSTTTSSMGGGCFHI